MPLLFGEHGDAAQAHGAHAFQRSRPTACSRPRDGHADPDLRPERSRVGGALQQGARRSRSWRTDPRFATNPARIANRAETDGLDRALLRHSRTWRRYRRQLDAAADRVRARQRRGGRAAPSAPAARDGRLAATARSTLPAPPARFSGEGEPDFGPLPRSESTPSACGGSSSGSIACSFCRAGQFVYEELAGRRPAPSPMEQE